MEALQGEEAHISACAEVWEGRFAGGSRSRAALRSLPDSRKYRGQIFPKIEKVYFAIAPGPRCNFPEHFMHGLNTYDHRLGHLGRP